MKAKNNTSNHKFLVLMDDSKASYNGLINAVSLAKVINGSVDIFQVASPTSVVTQDHQLASMTAMGKETSKQKKKLQKLVDGITKKEGIEVNFGFSIGNVKNEIKNYVEITKPDIIVLGKRKNKIFNFLGDQLTEEILKTHNGGVLICSTKENIISYSNQSIGFLDNLSGFEKLSIFKDLKKISEKPLKIFKNKSSDEFINSQVKSTKNNTVVFEFDANKSANDMANFISKNNLALLCVNNKKEKTNSFLSTLNNTITNTIRNTNTPILVLNNNLKYNYESTH